MLDNSKLSVGTIRVLYDFNINSMEQLEIALLPQVGDRPHVYSSTVFKDKHLKEINEYFYSHQIVNTPTLQILYEAVRLLKRLDDNNRYKEGLLSSVGNVVDLEEMLVIFN